MQFEEKCKQNEGIYRVLDQVAKAESIVIENPPLEILEDLKRVNLVLKKWVYEDEQSFKVLFKNLDIKKFLELKSLRKQLHARARGTYFLQGLS